VPLTTTSEGNESPLDLWAVFCLIVLFVVVVGLLWELAGKKNEYYQLVAKYNVCVVECNCEPIEIVK